MSTRSIERRLSRAEKKLKQHTQRRMEADMDSRKTAKRILWQCTRCGKEEVVIPELTDKEDRLPPKWQWIRGHGSSGHWLLCDQCIEQHQKFMEQV